MTGNIRVLVYVVVSANGLLLLKTMRVHILLILLQRAALLLEFHIFLLFQVKLRGLSSQNGFLRRNFRCLGNDTRQGQMKRVLFLMQSLGNHHHWFRLSLLDILLLVSDYLGLFCYRI